MRLALAVIFALGIAGCEDCNGPGPGPSPCCKVCTDSKPCGDSCISRSQTCNVGPGCACSGFVLEALE